ncbi:Nramp family divalent metal transporter [Halapricum hydrolyticum]|uniref:Nramp family divalent metal transporter n=1 Tax=Halapricum hydrolyticum TaxID=2979991 RepID=A0AAE3I9S2_9EURY|nr:Nramp family divalent metal transporter [Halapricum hydrolyticum]MCU4717114.1 Nramp family divalent metal transporter [Halapricum hydrolyticum]MCU4726041.1 Nramp family divalent metal transporter [Halapricum hydrolyticum]
MSDDDMPVRDDVYLSGSEGRTYHGSSYMPTAYDNLDIAREDATQPARGDDEGFRLLDLPRVPRLSHVLGPSAILLGASLGSGETLFWPLLVATHGWDLYWLFFLGVFTQFFLNTEIQRWTVATGESIFRGFERLGRVWPLVLLVLGFASLGWPGWAAGAARIGTIGLGIEETTVGLDGIGLASWRVLGIALLVVVWLTYQVTPVMYNVVERIQAVLVSAALLIAILLFVLLGSISELAAIPTTVDSVGQLPPGGDIALLLGGIAFAGAGGYLNLSQSLWVREKGYGMGRYQGRIKNPIVGDDPEPVRRGGFTFPPTPTNMRRWRGWWRLVQLEHLLTFVLGLVAVATMLMAIAAEYAAGTAESGIAMWTDVVAPQVGALPGVLLYVALFTALLTTEYGIVESFVRNSADIVYELHGRSAGWSLPRLFWALLTVFTGGGIAVLALPVPFAFDHPFELLVVGAAASGLMMWPYTALLAIMNTERLPEHTQPSWTRLAMLWWATALFGYFSVLLLGTWASAAGLPWVETDAGVLASEPGGLALFAVAAFVVGFVVVRSARAKLASKDTVPGSEQAQGPLH